MGSWEKTKRKKNKNLCNPCNLWFHFFWLRLAAMGNLWFLHAGNLALHEGYKQMAADKERETEAREWTEATFKDSCNETW
jgi:hypothetical protein